MRVKGLEDARFYLNNIADVAEHIEAMLKLNLHITAGRLHVAAGSE